MEYIDFDIRLGTRNPDGTYPVDTHSVLAGHARGSAIIPLAGSRALDLVYASAATGASSIETLGKALFQAVMVGLPLRCYASSRSRCFDAKKGLRIRVDVLDPALALLPWELLYDEQGGDDFLALSLRSPIVRYLELPYSNLAPSLQVPVRVLVVTASPSDLMLLNVAAEQSRITQALDALVRQGSVVVDFLPKTTRRLLQSKLKQNYDVFHFVGHASCSDNQGALFLENDQGQAEPIAAHQLSTLLVDSKTSIAILNACQTADPGRSELHGGIGPLLARAGIPVVIGMRDQILDSASYTFSEQFYGDLADGLPIEAAITEARKAMMLAFGRDQDYWSQPVLYTQVPALAVRPRTAADPRRYVQIHLSMRLALETAGRAGSQSQRDMLRNVFGLLRPTHVNVVIAFQRYLGAALDVIAPVSTSVVSPPLFQWSIGDDIALACETFEHRSGIRSSLTAQATILEGWRPVWQSPLATLVSSEPWSAATEAAEIRQIACPPDVFAGLAGHKKYSWMLELTFPIVDADGKPGKQKIAQTAAFRVLDGQERETLTASLASLSTQTGGPEESALLSGLIHEASGVYDEAERRYREVLATAELRKQASQRLAQVFYKRAYQLLGLPGEQPAGTPINSFLQKAAEFQQQVDAMALDRVTG